MQQNEEHRTGAPLLASIGVVLLAIGGAVALFVASEVLALYRHPDSHQFIAYLSGNLSGSELVDTMIIGDGGATIVAFALFGLMVLIGAGIAFAFIRVGHDLASRHIQLKREFLSRSKRHDA